MRSVIIFIVLGALALAEILPGLSAYDAASGAAARPQDEMRELKQRFEERYPELVRHKRAGRVGETFGGLIAPLAAAFVESDEELRRFIEVENDDREHLYELLARDVKDEIDEPARERVTAEIVAERNAKRNFRNAKDSEFLRMEDGVWMRKRDERGYEAILELKREGALREGEDGLLSVEGDDAANRRAVDAENDRRRAMFEEIAKAADANASAIAREHAREHESRIESRRVDQDAR
jgi:uncharacterized protein YdbL (DUF1318 family)